MVFSKRDFFIKRTGSRSNEYTRACFSTSLNGTRSKERRTTGTAIYSLCASWFYKVYTRVTRTRRCRFVTRTPGRALKSQWNSPAAPLSSAPLPPAATAAPALPPTEHYNSRCHTENRAIYNGRLSKNIRTYGIYSTYHKEKRFGGFAAAHFALHRHSAELEMQQQQQHLARACIIWRRRLRKIRGESSINKNSCIYTFSFPRYRVHLARWQKVKNYKAEGEVQHRSRGKLTRDAREKCTARRARRKPMFTGMHVPSPWRVYKTREGISKTTLLRKLTFNGVFTSDARACVILLRDLAKLHRSTAARKMRGCREREREREREIRMREEEAVCVLYNSVCRGYAQKRRARRDVLLPSLGILYLDTWSRDLKK
ncbi:unnamed protein product [Trichogramma brassicae]|uniref:Uncharacterized protein n=1 Tax=Trichogramma brassicae TaxID=86971 RepID=A0A6H5ITZ3_9HYME|nr:unnamed protein product [Trichogramma brassicae]